MSEPSNSARPTDPSARAGRSLPIWMVQEPILRALRSGNRLVLVAPTGSGKTTQVPQMLVDEEMMGRKKVVILQPRRVAARTVAARVAWERGVVLGGEVGYQIRFDDQTSLGTRICYVTEGVLLRWLQTDASLPDIGALIFDEFHERNLLSDVTLALAKSIQETRRPDLKIVVMSATMDADPVAKYLGPRAVPDLAEVSGKSTPTDSVAALNACPIVISEGRTFGVEVQYLPEREERPISEQAALAVARIVEGGDPGDILVFMPGMGEINATINALRTTRIRERLIALPLHGELPAEDQDRAFAPQEFRKVVVSTNVAETSVTIDGIRHVVDSGLARVARYDSERGIATLGLEPISRASAEQRKGRAGRTAPGTCHRLWTESGHLNRPERNTPEIQRSDLAEVILLLHSLGIRQAAKFDWLDRPDPQAVERAEKLLVVLGALSSDDGMLTPVGLQMLRLPMHPRYSRMLVEAVRYHCVPAAALCAALVSGRDLLLRLGRDDKHMAEAREVFEASEESDFYRLIRAFQFAKERDFSVEACRRYGIHAQTARQVEQTYLQILEIVGRQARVDRSAEQGLNERAGEGGDGIVGVGEPLWRCLMTGFIDQLCVRRDGGSLECFLTEGRAGTLMRESVVQKAPLFVAASIREVEGRATSKLTLLGLATAVQRNWVEETFPEHLSSVVEHVYDRTHKRVAAIRIVRFLDLVLHQEHQRETDPHASGRSLAEAYFEGHFELPLFHHELKQFVARANLIAFARPELDFPSYTREATLLCLANAFKGLTLVKEAQAADLRVPFRQHLQKEQLEWLDELAPLTVEWPDGRKLKLLYLEQPGSGPGQIQAPELQVKLHECFALLAHPRICESRISVKLWLGGPDGKRLAFTNDWPEFKAREYPKLKATLQKRYPGVAWL